MLGPPRASDTFFSIRLRPARGAAHDYHGLEMDVS